MGHSKCATIPFKLPFPREVDNWSFAKLHTCQWHRCTCSKLMTGGKREYVPFDIAIGEAVFERCEQKMQDLQRVTAVTWEFKKRSTPEAVHSALRSHHVQTIH